jgi:penicillin-binding protein A
VDWIERLLSAETAPRIVTGLKVAFFLLTANLLRMLLRTGAQIKPPAKDTGRRAMRVFYGFVLPLMGGLLVYQATWQLTGFARPGFVRFMQRYNRRPVNPARRRLRGRILDRNGVPLAVNDARNPLLRHYPEGNALCHAVGYSDSTFGLTGVERAEDASLSGTSLSNRNEVDRFGRNIVDRQAIRGNDLSLTLDARLQREAVRMLRGKRGAVVVLRPSDGALLTLASAPSYDPNALTRSLMRGGEGESALFNRALHGLYPPGSTFKIVTAAMAVESGFTGHLDCPANGFVADRGARPIRDHEYYACQRAGRTWRGHGLLDLGTAFARSSNVFFAMIGADTASSRFNAVADRFRLRSPILLLDGGSGAIRSKAGGMPRLADAARRERAQVAIGQGRLLLTPLHMALVAAAVAEDGRMYRPRLKRLVPVTLLSNAMSAQTARRVRALMRQAVQTGTGRGADVPGISVAGKTGTAQAPGGDDHAWFVCLAPVEAPAVAMAVVIEHGGSGSRTAVPVAVSVLRKAEELGLLVRTAGGGGG